MYDHTYLCTTAELFLLVNVLLTTFCATGKMEWSGTSKAQTFSTTKKRKRTKHNNKFREKKAKDGPAGETPKAAIETPKTASETPKAGVSAALQEALNRIEELEQENRHLKQDNASLRADKASATASTSTTTSTSSSAPPRRAVCSCTHAGCCCRHLSPQAFCLFCPGTEAEDGGE